MAADVQLRDNVLRVLGPLGEITSRSMFGGYGIFSTGKMFALIAGSALFFKVDDSNLSSYRTLGSAQYGSMPYYRVPSSLIEDEDELTRMAKESIMVANAAAGKKRR